MPLIMCSCASVEQTARMAWHDTEQTLGQSVQRFEACVDKAEGLDPATVKRGRQLLADVTVLLQVGATLIPMIVQGIADAHDAQSWIADVFHAGMDLRSTLHQLCAK